MKELFSNIVSKIKAEDIVFSDTQPRRLVKLQTSKGGCRKLFRNVGSYLLNDTALYFNKHISTNTSVRTPKSKDERFNFLKPSGYPMYRPPSLALRTLFCPSLCTLVNGKSCDETKPVTMDNVHILHYTHVLLIVT